MTTRPTPIAEAISALGVERGEFRVEWGQAKAAAQAVADMQAQIAAARAAGAPPAQMAALARQMAPLRTALAREQREATAARQAVVAARQAKRSTVANWRTFIGNARLTVPYLPNALIRVYTEAWIRTNDPLLAMAAVEQDPRLEEFFPGIRRDNGTLRMPINEYGAVVEAFDEALLRAGINPTTMRGRYGELIEGNVSADEFRSRVVAMSERVLAEEPAMMEMYASYYGIEMNRGSLIAAALDPQINEAILSRQISTAEIGGAAAIAGFRLSRDTATELYQYGLTEQTARETFMEAAQKLPGFGRAAERQREGEFGLGEYLGAANLLGTAEQRRLATEKAGRMLAGEASQFTEQEFAAQATPYTLTGLSAR